MQFFSNSVIRPDHVDGLHAVAWRGGIKHRAADSLIIDRFEIFEMLLDIRLDDSTQTVGISNQNLVAGI